MFSFSTLSCSQKQHQLYSGHQPGAALAFVDGRALVVDDGPALVLVDRLALPLVLGLVLGGALLLVDHVAGGHRLVAAHPVVVGVANLKQAGKRSRIQLPIVVTRCFRRTRRKVTKSILPKPRLLSFGAKISRIWFPRLCYQFGSIPVLSQRDRPLECQ